MLFLRRKRAHIFEGERKVILLSSKNEFNLRDLEKEVKEHLEKQIEGFYRLNFDLKLPLKFYKTSRI